MKTRTMISAGAMAIALASLTAPNMAAAADRPERSNDSQHGDWGGRAGEHHNNQNNRNDQSQWHRADPNADRQIAQPAPQQRSNNDAPRTWAQAAQGNPNRADDRNAHDSGDRKNSWFHGDSNARSDAPRTWGQAAQGNTNRSDDRNSHDSGTRTGSRDHGDNVDRKNSWFHGDSNARNDDNRDRRGDAWRDNDSSRDRVDRRQDNRNGWDRDYRHDDRRDNRDWDRNSWRHDNRYDWQQYRDRHRSTYRIGRYYAPYYGYSYRRLGIGITIGSLFYGNRYWIDDPWDYRLPEVYGPYRWVRYYDDVLLVNIYTGEVVDVIYDFFW